MKENRTEIIIAGIGGQGVVYAANLIAKTALSSYNFTSMIAHYGPESRGSVTSTEVVLSNVKNDYPVVENPDIFIAMHQKGFEHYVSNQKANISNLKYIVYDSTLVTINENLKAQIPNFKLLMAVPATQLAKDELGNIQMANIILTAALTKGTGIFEKKDLEKTLEDMIALGEHERNIKAISLGYS